MGYIMKSSSKNNVFATFCVSAILYNIAVHAYGAAYVAAQMQLSDAELHCGCSYHSGAEQRGTKLFCDMQVLICTNDNNHNENASINNDDNKNNKNLSLSLSI